MYIHSYIHVCIQSFIQVGALGFPLFSSPPLSHTHTEFPEVTSESLDLKIFGGGGGVDRPTLPYDNLPFDNLMLFPPPKLNSCMKPCIYNNSITQIPGNNPLKCYHIILVLHYIPNSDTWKNTIEILLNIY